MHVKGKQIRTTGKSGDPGSGVEREARGGGN